MPNEPRPQILNQTLGELLQNNNQAQGIVMQAMQIGPEQLRQLLNMTGNNQLMNMTIGDLFKNGIVHQGQVTQISPRQFQQIINTLPSQTPQDPNIQTDQPVSQEDKVPYTLPQTSGKQSFLQKLKNLFR